MLKAAIVLMLLATLVSLFSGLFFLVRDEGHGSRVVGASTQGNWCPTSPGSPRYRT